MTNNENTFKISTGYLVFDRSKPEYNGSKNYETLDETDNSHGDAEDKEFVRRKTVDHKALVSDIEDACKWTGRKLNEYGVYINAKTYCLTEEAWAEFSAKMEVERQKFDALIQSASPYTACRGRFAVAAKKLAFDEGILECIHDGMVERLGKLKAAFLDGKAESAYAHLRIAKHFPDALTGTQGEIMEIAVGACRERLSELKAAIKESGDKADKARLGAALDLSELDCAIAEMSPNDF